MDNLYISRDWGQLHMARWVPQDHPAKLADREPPLGVPEPWLPQKKDMFNGILWDFMGFYGILWDFMGFNGI